MLPQPSSTFALGKFPTKRLLRRQGSFSLKGWLFLLICNLKFSFDSVLIYVFYKLPHTCPPSGPVMSWLFNHSQEKRAISEVHHDLLTPTISKETTHYTVGENDREIEIDNEILFCSIAKSRNEQSVHRERARTFFYLWEAFFSCSLPLEKVKKSEIDKKPGRLYEKRRVFEIWSLEAVQTDRSRLN